jgi:myosin-15
LRLEPSDLNKMALECFACIMRYMGDLGLLKNQTEVDCVNTILVSNLEISRKLLLCTLNN